MIHRGAFLFCGIILVGEGRSREDKIENHGIFVFFFFFEVRDKSFGA